MVSGRHKAYEQADEIPADSLANDTSASAFSLELKVREDVSIDGQHIRVGNQKFSRSTINQIVAEARGKKADALQSILSYAGQSPQLVEANGRAYVALAKLKSCRGRMHFIVYDLSDKLVKEAKTKFEKKTLEQEGPDDIYMDQINKLEEEYKKRR